ncbi:MAG TPA: 23S rRNA (adenine(2030)-N(6))-methyltransferase RlmJ [Steroidobacteraceae bacterium]|nr:23S rRNA (adenine(2030)-N(6))-methyltransferase RlmJ [Steroidobacteraceae bacterium]
MKYRHLHHAGNFADVHKHVTLLALLATLKRKDKGFLYLETHAGRGAYDLSGPAGEAASGFGRLEAQFPAGVAAQTVAEEIRRYSSQVELLRRERGEPRLYPGSPLLAASELRPADRAVFIEQLPAEARALEKALHHSGVTEQRFRVETGDGFDRLRAWLPPNERRGLTLIDPPYEESRQDFERARQAAAEALRRFHTGVVAVWYPIKDERDTADWHAGLVGALDCPLLAAELSLYPRDSRVALNGSGMVILNPPYQLAERMEVWLPQLHTCLDLGHGGGTSVRRLK